MPAYSNLHCSANGSTALHQTTGIIALSAFSDNYIWLIHNGKDAMVVDPGQAAPVERALNERNLKLTAILLTHHHQDHVGGVADLVSQTGAMVYGPAGEVLPICDVALVEGDVVSDTGMQLSLSVLDVPGHTAGHIAFAGDIAGQPVLFCGDTLFAAGCGRLFEGTAAQMDESLAKLAALPPATAVYCAHEYTLSNMRWALAVEPGNLTLQSWQARAEQQRAQGQPTLPSFIGQELSCNPFLRARQPEIAHAAAVWAERTLNSPVEVFAALREWKNNFR
ncbi:MAG: hydroxyacylglutathione hydrolase [Burkholderiales bacterium]|jgi:hydroxyacylglutathione hydrolase|nr:hydroxyacylglutathione hydrolase [Burkholderiales bacterium]MDP4969885.1 hydroxyacylglutathione hydrolase [Burkholderiaceae bacterium]MDP5112113.1 hydroxyacylglutathione hydrolase [Burkholderiaceae bacterium]